MTIAGMVLAVILAIGGEGTFMGGRIAVLPVDGVIADDTDYLDQIRSFRDDPSIKGILVPINSPGGVVGPSQSLYRELRRLREDGFPVIATIGSVGASGGYYVALAADSIFVLPGSLTGSIGVVMEFPQAYDLLHKLGVGVEVVKSAEFKDIGSPFRPFSPDDRAVVESLIQDVYEQFVEVVATERNLPLESVRPLADGRVLSGRQALEAGLVDRIGNLTDALSTVGRMAGLGDDPRIVWPSKPKFSLLDMILGRGATSNLAKLVQSVERSGGPSLKFVVPN